MILYFGNILSEYGYTPTFIELLTPKLSQYYQIESVSNKKGQIPRFLHMLKTFFKNKKKVKLVLIDSYSMRAFWYTYILAKLCVNYKIPYMPILRGGGYPDRIKKSPGFCKFIFSNSVKNISPSVYLKNHFENAGYKVTYIPNFIPLSNYQYKERTSVRPRLLWVRSFHEIYNPLLAVEVLEKLSSKYPDAELCMVGPDKDGTLQEVIERANVSGVNRFLKLTGKLSKPEWLKLSETYDIFINTTNFDNHPVSVIEAMALGLPVISTNVGGIPFLIDDNVDGVLVPQSDPEKFVQAINSLITDESLVKGLSKNARSKVEQFDWDVLKHKWFETISPYENIIKNN